MRELDFYTEHSAKQLLHGKSDLNLGLLKLSQNQWTYLNCNLKKALGDHDCEHIHDK
jgi:hypothetical protein